MDSYALYFPIEIQTIKKTYDIQPTLVRVKIFTNITPHRKHKPYTYLKKLRLSQINYY